MAGHWWTLVDSLEKQLSIGIGFWIVDLWRNLSKPRGVEELLRHIVARTCWCRPLSVSHPPPGLVIEGVLPK